MKPREAKDIYQETVKAERILQLFLQSWGEIIVVYGGVSYRKAVILVVFHLENFVWRENFHIMKLLTYYQF
jgi:hypothetical protein